MKWMRHIIKKGSICDSVDLRDAGEIFALPPDRLSAIHIDVIIRGAAQIKPVPSLRQQNHIHYKLEIFINTRQPLDHLNRQPYTCYEMIEM